MKRGLRILRMKGRTLNVLLIRWPLKLKRNWHIDRLQSASRHYVILSDFTKLFPWRAQLLKAFAAFFGPKLWPKGLNTSKPDACCCCGLCTMWSCPNDRPLGHLWLHIHTKNRYSEECISTCIHGFERILTTFWPLINQGVKNST